MNAKRATGLPAIGEVAIRSHVEVIHSPPEVLAGQGELVAGAYPNYVIETSTGRFQYFSGFERSEPVKPVVERLKHSADYDRRLPAWQCRGGAT